LIKSYVRKVREKGAKLVIVHGETLLEPVPPGTNRAALEADVDILAHPGLIKEGIYLEISARKGHCLANGRVAFLARKYGAKLIIGSDAHAPEDLLTLSEAEKILLGAGLSEEEVKKTFQDSEKLVKRLLL